MTKDNPAIDQVHQGLCASAPDARHVFMRSPEMRIPILAKTRNTDNEPKYVYLRHTFRIVVPLPQVSTEVLPFVRDTLGPTIHTYFAAEFKDKYDCIFGYLAFVTDQGYLDLRVAHAYEHLA